MARVSRKKTKRGGGRRTRRLKGGTDNYIPRNNVNPIDGNLFVPSRELQRIPSGVMNSNASSGQRVNHVYNVDIEKLLRSPFSLNDIVMQDNDSLFIAKKPNLMTIFFELFSNIF